MHPHNSRQFHRLGFIARCIAYKYLLLSIGIIFTTVSIAYAFIAPKSVAPPTPSNELVVNPKHTIPKHTIHTVAKLNTPAVRLETAQNTPSPPIKTTSFTHQVRQNENLSTIFSKFKLSQVDLHNITHTNKLGKQFATILAGKTLQITVDANNQLEQLMYHENLIDTLVAKRINHKFSIERTQNIVERKITSTHVVINSSLFIDAQNAGLSDKLIMQLSNIFAWDIDFALNLRRGDMCTVIYENIFIAGKKVGTSNILATKFVNRGRLYTAVRFENKEGFGAYFTPDGKSMHKVFLRAPVDFSRISSRFNLKRQHPVLNKIRAHKGVDYAARIGTPIKATGDGKITFRGYKGGYGRVIIVQHGPKYSTLYAHLSRHQKGQKTGSRVKQGQTIGYVGKSGLATGAHLHYEFRVNGVHKNPLTIKIANATPLKESLLAKFKQQTQPLVAQLNAPQNNIVVAHN